MTQPPSDCGAQTGHHWPRSGVQFCRGISRKRMGGRAMWFLQSVFAPLLAVAAVVGLAVTAMWWCHTRSSALLQAWADANGYRILHQQYRFLMRGPFFFTTGRVVYEPGVPASTRPRQLAARTGTSKAEARPDQAKALLSEELMIAADSPGSTMNHR
jgi:hypothetical protein